MTVVDASVWVSRLVDHDVHHAASRRWLESYGAQGEVVVGPVLLLAEVAAAVRRKTGRAGLARRAVREILRLPNLTLVAVDRALAEAAASLAAELSLRGPDAVYVATAHELSIPLVTWDGEQLRRGGRRIVVSRPA